VNSEDRKVIDACLNGQVSEFNRLVQRYQDRLFNSVLRVVNNKDDASDVVQESFLNAFQSLKSFKGDSEFFTWLYRIAFNAAITQRRKKRQNLSLDAHDGESISPADESFDSQPGRPMERREIEIVVHRAINRLSEDHKTVIVLRDIDGLSYEELAEVLNVPIGTVRSRLSRARLELRNLLEEKENQ
jgi:RNA polymerase sigma-70 factor, ECF subfamily